MLPKVRPSLLEELGVKRGGVCAKTVDARSRTVEVRAVNECMFMNCNDSLIFSISGSIRCKCPVEQLEKMEVHGGDL